METLVTDIRTRTTPETARTPLTDFLTGILKAGNDPDVAREESLRTKYEIAD